jgi:predicted AlkP superfamily pyrophosphatase or phosphodiesterase
MNKLILPVTVLCFVLLVVSCKGNDKNKHIATNTPFVLLISIDGLTPEYIFTEQASIPYLKDFLIAGSYAQSVEGVIPTLTYPSHTTILTGQYPAQHGIYSNTKFSSSEPAKWYWYADEIKTETLWDVAKARNKVVASVQWPVSVNADIDFNIPPYWYGQPEKDPSLVDSIETPNFISELETGELLKGQGLQQDLQRIAITDQLISKKEIDFVTLHLGSFDMAGHQQGHLSPQAKQRLEQIDNALQTLEDRIKATHGSNYIISIVSDHGFYEVSNNISLNTLFYQAGLITLNEGEVGNWQAFAWGDGGSVAILLNEDDENLRQNVKTILNEYKISSGSGIASILERDQFDRFAYPQADFLLEAEIAYQFVQFPVAQSPIKKAVKSVSNHGRFPQRDDMKAVFLVKGEGIPPGKNLGDIKMIDIFPILAERLAQ